MNTSDVLNRTADSLERDGWMNPHQCTDGWSPTCAQVAIGRIANYDVLYFAAEKALLAHIGGTTVSDIWAWNDAPNRTATEVVEALRACAVIEAAKENAETRTPVTV